MIRKSKSLSPWHKMVVSESKLIELGTEFEYKLVSDPPYAYRMIFHWNNKHDSHATGAHYTRLNIFNSTNRSRRMRCR